eukprot:8081897-Pyramimonas_sp.AAC.1
MGAQSSCRSRHAYAAAPSARLASMRAEESGAYIAALSQRRRICTPLPSRQILARLIEDASAYLFGQGPLEETAARGAPSC